MEGVICGLNLAFSLFFVCMSFERINSRICLTVLDEYNFACEKYHYHRCLCVKTRWYTRKFVYYFEPYILVGAVYLDKGPYRETLLVA